MNLTSDVAMLLGSTSTGLAVFLGAIWLVPVWDAVAARQVADLGPRMHELNLDQSRLPRYLRWWGLGMLAAFLIVALVLRWYLLAPGAVYLVYILPRSILQARIAQRRTLLRDQLVSCSVALANATRAGLSLAQGIESISKETPEPLAHELRRVSREYNHGRPLGDAIRDLKTQLNQEGFTLLASALLTCLERGGKVTEALERISKSLQENQRLERKLDADTASGRKVVLILGAFPILFLLGFYALDPDGTSILFSTIVGQLVLVSVAVLVYASVQWAKRILGVDIS